MARLARDIMTLGPACCTPSMTLDDVAKMMVECDCGCIPVVDGQDSKMPVGMITDRDITCRVVAQGKNPLDLTARDADLSAKRTTIQKKIDELQKLRIKAYGSSGKSAVKLGRTTEYAYPPETR